MTKTIQNVVIAVIGVITVTASANGLFLNFVKPSMRWPLVAAGAVLVVLALVSMVRGEDEPPPEAEDLSWLPGHTASGAEGLGEGVVSDHPHTHGRGPRVGWALVVPFLLLGTLAPSPLGAYAAQRMSGSVASRQLTASGFPVLQADDPVPLTLTDYSGRALADSTASLKGRTVVLTGWVLSGQQSNVSWYLTRMSISCCAADGFPVKIEVRGMQEYPEGTWVVVTGTWVEGSAGTEAQPLAIVQSDDVSVIPAPAEPYEQP
jgi:uncharacterized repeat protein (TIGR03943 family)